VLEVWVEDEEGRRLPAIPQGQRIALRAHVRFMVDVEDPQAAVHVYNEDHTAVVVASSWVQHDHSGRFHRGEEVVFSFSFDNVLAPGRYSPVITLAHRGSGLDVMDRYERGFSFVVTSTLAMGGIVDLATDVTIERVPSPVAEEIEA
jgi:hypothetical protein